MGNNRALLIPGNVRWASSHGNQTTPFCRDLGSVSTLPGKGRGLAKTLRHTPPFIGSIVLLISGFRVRVPARVPTKSIGQAIFAPKFFDVFENWEHIGSKLEGGFLYAHVANLHRPMLRFFSFRNALIDIRVPAMSFGRDTAGLSATVTSARKVLWLQLPVVR